MNVVNVYTGKCLRLGRRSHWRGLVNHICLYDAIEAIDLMYKIIFVCVCILCPGVALIRVIRVNMDCLTTISIITRHLRSFMFAQQTSTACHTTGTNTHTPRYWTQNPRLTQRCVYCIYNTKEIIRCNLKHISTDKLAHLRKYARNTGVHIKDCM